MKAKTEIIHIKIQLFKCLKAFRGAYETPEKYVSKKNNTRKIKKNYL